MKFAGVVTSGKDKGKVIEFEPKEKAEEALKYVLTQNPEIDGEYPFNGRLVFTKSITVSDVQHSQAGEPLGSGRFQNNVYEASGKASIQERRMTDDKLLPERAISWRMKFKDILQENGVPDLEITDFQIHKE